MKKNLFLAICLIGALSSCQNLDNVSPIDDNSSSSAGQSSSSSSSSSSNTIPISTLPTSVKTFISTKYPAYTIHEVQIEWEHGVSYYKVNLRNGKKDRKNLIFSSAWVFIREKN